VRASDREGTRRGNKSEGREKARGEERAGRSKEEEREEDAQRERQSVSMYECALAVAFPFRVPAGLQAEKKR
jgi:hypothetical protein